MKRTLFSTFSAAGACLLATWASFGPAACAAEGSPLPATRVIASCDFEGPYSEGEQQIHDGCANNWQWGRKDMVLKAEKDAGRPGTVQSIHVRGITSGGMQFFYTKLQLKKDHYYRISYWMKTDGLEGPVRCYVRQVGYPWTVYVYGDYEPRTTEWREYSFTGKCAEEVNEDVGVCWETGSLGKIWLDDLTVEESAEPFPSGPTRPVVAPPRGNLLPRSSFEGRRDHLWSMGFFGWARNGVWEGVESEWEDPQMVRAEGGQVGRYCLAVPSATHAGQGAAHSILLEVLPGQPYTVSAWMRSDPPGYPGSVALLYWWSGTGHLQSAGGMYPPLTAKWQRYSFTVTPQPTTGAADTTSPIKMFLQIAPSALQKGTVFVDGLQVEAGEQATEYKPAFPLELYADVGQDGGNLIEWGQRVPLNVLAAAAEATTLAQTKVEITVTGYPNVVVWRRIFNLTVGKETLVPLDLKRRGLFRVSLRTVNEQEAAPQEMLFALVPRPRDTGEKGMFGAHITVRPFHAHYFQRLGFTWTRLHDCSTITKWSWVEPERGKYSWHDEVVEGLRKTGMHILGLPDQPPKWAQIEPGQGDNVIDLEAFGKYCEAVARHYRGKIDHWEVWNEPYMPGSYSGGMQKFGDVMKTAYAALKRGNPDCQVVGWCADIGNVGYSQAIPEDARKCLDIFSFHHYINNLSGGGTLPFAGELPDHLKLLGDQIPLEVWNTEGTNGEVCANSMYTFLPGVSPEKNDRACAFASRVWIEHKKAGVDKFFVYQMHNTDTMAYFGGYQSLFLGYDRSPTPAAVAAATTAYGIDGLKPVPFQPVEGVVQGLFEGDGRATWVVYDDSGVVGRKRLRLTQLPRDAEVLDVMGNDPRRDGKKEWGIGIQPLFVMSERLSAKGLVSVAQRAIQE